MISFSCQNKSGEHWSSPDMTKRLWAIDEWMNDDTFWGNSYGHWSRKGVGTDYSKHVLNITRKSYSAFSRSFSAKHS